MTDINEDIYLGAFFIIDHAGQCPPATTERDFQDGMIEAHLQRHTYFYDSPEGRERADVKKMRSVFRDLYFHELASGEATKLAYSCQPDEDHAEPFFRLGTQQLPHQMLALYDYDKSTFQEGRLPDYKPPSMPKKSHVNAQHKYARRSFWVVIQDIEASKGSRGNSSHKYRDHESRLNALQVLIQDYQLTHETGAGIRPFSSRELSKTFLATWRSKNAADAASGASPWQSDITDWKPEYINTIRQISNELSHSESLPSHNPATAVALSADLGLDDDHLMRATQANSAGHGSAGNHDCDEIQVVHGGETNVGSSYVDDDKDSTLDEHTSNVARASATSPFVLLPIPDPVESTHGARPRALRASTRQAKRTPPLCETPASPKRQRTRDATPSKSGTGALQITVKTNAALASWVVDRLGNETRCAPTTSTSLPARLVESRRSHQVISQAGLIPLNLTQSEEEFRQLYLLTASTSNILLESVGDVGQDTMPLERELLQSTQELHIRCWGIEWQQMRAKLKKANLFSVPDVTMSLISAYVLNQVLSRQVRETLVSVAFEEGSASGTIGDGKVEAPLATPTRD